MRTVTDRIQVPEADVYGLAAQLVQQSWLATETARGLAPGSPVGGPLEPAVEDFLECHRTAISAVAGELRWLADTVAAVVDSWRALDGAVLVNRGRATPR